MMILFTFLLLFAISLKNVNVLNDKSVVGNKEYFEKKYRCLFWGFQKDSIVGAKIKRYFILKIIFVHTFYFFCNIIVHDIIVEYAKNTKNI